MLFDTASSFKHLRTGASHARSRIPLPPPPPPSPGPNQRHGSTASVRTTTLPDGRPKGSN